MSAAGEVWSCQSARCLPPCPTKYFPPSIEPRTWGTERYPGGVEAAKGVGESLSLLFCACVTLSLASSRRHPLSCETVKSLKTPSLHSRSVHTGLRKDLSPSVGQVHVSFRASVCQIDRGMYGAFMWFRGDTRVCIVKLEDSSMESCSFHPERGDSLLLGECTWVESPLRGGSPLLPVDIAIESNRKSSEWVTPLAQSVRVSK